HGCVCVCVCVCVCEPCSGMARYRILSGEKPGMSTQRLQSAGSTATLPAGGWQGRWDGPHAMFSVRKGVDSWQRRLGD
ncbi:hypothetical protein LX36DRAFT_659278, partial [Colletotrichum falcatum]